MIASNMKYNSRYAVKRNERGSFFLAVAYCIAQSDSFWVWFQLKCIQFLDDLVFMETFGFEETTK